MKIFSLLSKFFQVDKERADIRSRFYHLAEICKKMELPLKHQIIWKVNGSILQKEILNYSCDKFWSKVT